VDFFQAKGLAKEFLDKHAPDLADDYWDRFHSNMRQAGVDAHVRAIRSGSAEAGESWAGPPVGLLFIDADHSYPAVRRDWECWNGRLAPRGIIAFHDYGNPAYEVKRFVDELLAARRLKSLGQVDSILIGEMVHEPAAR